LILTAANFDAHASKSDIPLLVDFWASWCGRCRQMAPALTAAAVQLEPGVRLGKLDTEAEQAIATRFAILDTDPRPVVQRPRDCASIRGDADGRHRPVGPIVDARLIAAAIRRSNEVLRMEVRIECSPDKAGLRTTLATTGTLSKTIRLMPVWQNAYDRVLVGEAIINSSHPTMSAWTLT
jgi:thiol-disulfide isomerase/thioredoxin